MTSAIERKRRKELSAWKEDLKDVIKTFAEQSKGQGFINEELFLDFALKCENGEF